jgi:Putative zinc-finger
MNDGRKAESEAPVNCTQIETWLPLYASADLPEAQLAQVRAHLAQCETCAASAAEFAAAREWLHGTAAPEFDEAFYADLRYAVQQELAAQPARVAWWPLHWKPLLVAAALLLLTIFSLRLFQTKGVPTTDIVNLPASPQLPDAVREPMPPINKLAQTLKSRVPLRKQGNALRIKLEEKDTIAAVMTKPAMAGATKTVTEPMMARIEIQTADPNIRIIWLSPQVTQVSAER